MHKTTILAMVLFCATIFAEKLGIWEGTYYNLTMLEEIVSKKDLYLINTPTITLKDGAIAFNDPSDTTTFTLQINIGSKKRLYCSLLNDYWNREIHAYRTSNDTKRRFTILGDTYIHERDFWGTSLDNYDIKPLMAALFFSRGFWTIETQKPFGLVADIDRESSSVSWKYNTGDTTLPFTGGDIQERYGCKIFAFNNKVHELFERRDTLTVITLNSSEDMPIDTSGPRLKVAKGAATFRSLGAMRYRAPSRFATRIMKVQKGDSFYPIAKIAGRDTTGYYKGNWIFGYSSDGFGWIFEKSLEQILSPDGKGLTRKYGYFINRDIQNYGVYLQDSTEKIRPLPPTHPERMRSVDIAVRQLDEGGELDLLFCFFYEDSIEFSPLVAVKEETTVGKEGIEFLQQPNVTVAGKEIQKLSLISSSEEWSTLLIQTDADSMHMKIRRNQRLPRKDVYALVLGGDSTSTVADSLLEKFHATHLPARIVQSGYPLVTASDSLEGAEKGRTLLIAALLPTKAQADSCLTLVSRKFNGATVATVQILERETLPPCMIDPKAKRKKKKK